MSGNKKPLKSLRAAGVAISSLLLVIFLLSPAVAYAGAAIDMVNRENSWLINVSFLDNSGNPVTPTTFNYKIENITANQTIVPATSGAVTGSSLVIEAVPATQQIINASDNSEDLRFTCWFTYGTGREGTGEYDYRIKNLKGLPN